MHRILLHAAKAVIKTNAVHIGFTCTRLIEWRVAAVLGIVAVLVLGGASEVRCALSDTPHELLAEQVLAR